MKFVSGLLNHRFSTGSDAIIFAYGTQSWVQLWFFESLKSAYNWIWVNMYIKDETDIGLQLQSISLQNLTWAVNHFPIGWLDSSGLVCNKACLLGKEYNSIWDFKEAFFCENWSLGSILIFYYVKTLILHFFFLIKFNIWVKLEICGFLWTFGHYYSVLVLL